MSIKELQSGDWISIIWIGYLLYVIENNENVLIVSSPSWGLNDTMRFNHWRFDYLSGNCWKFLGKSKTNPLYNSITKLTGFVHPFTLVKH
jgi:hypothetical protein